MAKVNETTEDKDLSEYLEKEPTDLQARFAEWIKEKLEITFGTKKEEAAFDEGVRLATALRMIFQASPENQAANAARKAKRKEAKEEAEAPAEKSTGKKGKKAAEPEEPEEPEEAPAPKKGKGKKAAAVEPPAKPAKGKKRRVASSDDDQAPF